MPVYTPEVIKNILTIFELVVWEVAEKESNKFLAELWSSFGVTG